MMHFEQIDVIKGESVFLCVSGYIGLTKFVQIFSCTNFIELGLDFYWGEQKHNTKVKDLLDFAAALRDGEDFYAESGPILLGIDQCPYPKMDCTIRCRTPESKSGFLEPLDIWESDVPFEMPRKLSAWIIDAVARLEGSGHDFPQALIRFTNAEMREAFIAWMSREGAQAFLSSQERKDADPYSLPWECSPVDEPVTVGIEALPCIDFSFLLGG